MAQMLIMATLLAMLLALAEGCFKGDRTGMTHLSDGGLQEVPLKIGSFNMESYSVAKNNNSTIQSYHRKILERYDVVLMTGATNTTSPAFSSLLDTIHTDYPEMVSNVSDMTSGEKYHILYNSTRLTLNITSLVDPDGMFKYDPYLLKFQSHDSAIATFALVAIRIDEANVTSEINSFPKVYDNVTEFYNIVNVVFLGDFQVPEMDPGALTSPNNVSLRLLTGDDEDTFVSAGAEYAGSRIITGGGDVWVGQAAFSAGVSRFDTEFNLSLSQAAEIADKFPVEFSLYGKINSAVLSVPAIYMIEWKQGTDEDPNILFPTNGSLLQGTADCEAKRGSGLLTKCNYLQGNLKKDVPCEETENALDEMALTYPTFVSKDAVTVWKQRFSDMFKCGGLPGVKMQCMVDIEYHLAPPFPYTIMVSSVPVS